MPLHQPRPILVPPLSRHSSRRKVLSTLASGSAALLGGCAAAKASVSPESFPVALARSTSSPNSGSRKRSEALSNQTGKHLALPLPFAPTQLRGLSERMIVSHHQNNYGGAVRNLNRVEQEIAGINAETPGFVVAALYERELVFRNSKTLHEAYFANLGGGGRRSGSIESALSKAFASSDQWEQHFRAIGSGLGGGSGWVVLAYELDTGTIRNTALASHSQSLSTALPLLVMDMYEHSYHIDFGSAVPHYLDAFFNNIHWDRVNQRLEQAEKLSKSLRGING